MAIKKIKNPSQKKKTDEFKYKRNLMNKINERTKYNHRHGNTEQTASDQRGGGVGGG